jgi:hypothetical protein
VIVDPFVHVQTKYKQQFQQNDPIIRTLQQISTHLDLSAFLPVLRQYIISQLIESHTSNTLSIKSVIGYLEVGESYLLDLPWFEQYFPEEIQMKYIFNVFTILEQQQ